LLNVTEDIMEAALSKLGDVGQKMGYFLSTGNITAKSGLDLRQKSGFSIMAERLNFLRYISHFRSVHRGQFYTEMRTTAVRKLLPDSWGFLCPVHTPDGAPCGLLNHLASPCEITQALYPEERYAELQRLLTSLGVREPNSFVTSDFVSVFCDGLIMGYVQASHAAAIAETLRKIKVTHKSTLKTLSIPLEEVVPSDLEVCYIPPGRTTRQYPTLYLFTGPTRMIRPVWNKSGTSLFAAIYILCLGASLNNAYCFV
jgi:DNA-directed RNA polymerase I subunit RPA2